MWNAHVASFRGFKAGARKVGSGLRSMFNVSLALSYPVRSSYMRLLSVAAFSIQLEGSLRRGKMRPGWYHPAAGCECMQFSTLNLTHSAILPSSWLVDRWSLTSQRGCQYCLSIYHLLPLSTRIAAESLRWTFPTSYC